MRIQLAAVAVGVGLSLAGCAMPVKAGDPTPTVTVTQPPTSHANDLAALEIVWGRLTADDKARMCGYVADYPDAAFTAFNDGRDRITRPDFDAFFSTHC